MAGLYVPLVMIPRFTSYLGAGTFASAPLDVTAFASFCVAVWRTPRLGNGGSGAALSLTFEDSDDAGVWTTVTGTSAITTGNTSSVVEADVTKRWLRVKLVLTADADGVVALTCWAMGNFVRREGA